MGSRLRDSPQRLFECWCEVVGPNDDTPAWIIQKFPKTYDEGEVLKSVPQFAFPCTFENSNVQHFSFVLTSLDSKWTYGFCRHAAKAETALVLLSFLPWHEVFYKLLNVCSDYLSSSSPEDVWLCLQEAYRCPTPAPGSDLVLPLPNDQHFMVQCPNHLRLPTIPDNRNLTEYYNAVDVNNMMIVFASMLYERRIIVTSKRLSRLSACVQAANAVLYPMVWQHIFIPVLPQHLVDYLLAPMPFLIGVCSSLLSKVRTEDIGEAVVLDADNNAVTTPFDDLASLPDEVIFNLKRSLKGNGGGMLGDVVARAFLRALVQLMGNYREALQFREEDKKITFNQEKFVAIRPPAFQPFVENMLHLQIFQQFIEERLQLLNSGKQTSDDFESEVSMHSDRSASKVRQQYKHFVTTFRKEGGAIMKTVKSKTNPAVKSAVKSVTKGGKQVKEKSRQTYKDLRGKIRDLQIPKEGTTTWETNGENYVVPKPRSAPSSPVLSAKRRPRTMGPGVAITAKTTYKRASQINIREDTGVLPGTRKYDLMESSSRLASPISSDGLHTPSPQDIDLMGEMEEILKTKLGQEEGSSPNHVSKQSVSSTSQVSTSAASSVSNSICNSVSNSPTVGNSLVAPQRRLARDNKLPSPLASRKPFSSSLDCLPLIDLSLNIEMPPPITPALCHFPVTFSDDDDDDDVDADGEGDGDGECHEAVAWNTCSSSGCRAAPSPLSSSNVSVPATANDGGQDLIYLESPQEELFDPLLSKEIPRSLPCLSQHQTLSSLKGPKPVQETSKLGNVSQSASSLPAPMASMLTNSSFNKTGLPSATPPRPAASMQGVSSEGRQYGSMQYNFGVPVGCNNPSYSQHQPPLGSGLVAAAKEKLSLASGVQTTPALGLTGNSSTRLGSATAAFASTMLQNPTDSGPSSGQYVQFQPPLRTKKDTSSKPLSSSSGTEHNHLLGDFSQDFKKLSVSGSQPSVAARAKDINLSTSNINNNNNNVQDKDTIANAKETKPVQPKPSEAPVRWMTFD
ncbi:DENN domain-containing protein 1A isoform X4 [Oratosquilla oratoria]|uniref:DENN domain-containing protein 1A isoform X4 n=1 Tax=Oratosquilla oratoria TaxID=337810 RepID=UPI003F7667E4